MNAVVEFDGEYEGPGGRIPYRLTVAQPNSKSWFDATLELRNVREMLDVRLAVPYVVERTPVLYDFGVGSWVYGALGGRQRASLVVRPGGEWQVLAPETAGGRPDAPAVNRVYAAASPVQPRSEGWAHLIDGAQGGRAIAFGSPELAGRSARAGAISIEASGVTTMAWELRAEPQVRVRALYHHVADPVHVSAATSPVSMLHPLQVTLPSRWHERSGAGRTPPGF